MMENKEPDQLMTLQEACAYWRVSESTGRRVILAKGIAKFSVGTGRNVRYLRKDIEKVVKPLEVSEQ